MAAPVLFRHPSSLEHDMGPHPEQPARILAIERMLSEHDWLGYERRESPAASHEQVEAVHPLEHLNMIEALCAAGGGAIDMDTSVCPASHEAGMHAAGGVCALVDALLAERVPAGASLHRPPGHHAERLRAMGFCLYNNVAIGARHARDEHGIERVLILDWDVHHGNGTQDIFYDDPGVMFCSIHQFPLYPGTGLPEEIGRGEGEGFTVNMPVPEGSGDELFCSLVEHLVVPIGERYRPGLILISAGFDAHRGDPLAGCAVSDDGYATMMRSMRALGDRVGAPVGVVLEGGYDLHALASGLKVVLEVLAEPGPLDAPDVPRHERLAD